MADHVGKQLGNYDLISLLGQGGFADVYLAEHVYLKTKTAIKVLQTRLLNDDFEAFLNEARTIARLTHPHIIRVLDFGIEGDTPFLVMEYAANGTLRERYPKGTLLPLDIIVSYTKQVASALQYAHDRKLIHRDVKPENMLLAANDNILLSDFGLVLTAQSSRQQNTQDAIGTLAYMAPEQLQGKPRPASDQYALGIIVYEWLSGDRPFHGNFTEMVSQHMLVTPPSLREKVPTISPEIERVVQTALAKDPHQRFTNVQLFATALEQACQSSASRRGITPLLGLSSGGVVPLEQVPTSITPPSDKLPAALPNQPSQLSPVPASASQSLRTPVLTPPDRATNPPPDRSSLMSPVPFATFGLPSLPTSVTPLSAPEQAPIVAPTTANYQSSVPWANQNQPALPRTISSPLSPSPQNDLQLRKRGSSRRVFILGLAGLAGLAAAGGGVALLIQSLQTPSTAVLPTVNPTQPTATNPAQQVSLTPLATEAPSPEQKPKPTPTSAPAPAPTSTPTQAPSPTPMATPTPKPTPTPTPTPKPTPTPVPVVSAGQAVLHASMSFNFDLGREVSSGGDVFWHQHTTIIRTLDPKGIAELVNLGGPLDLTQVTYADLKKLLYSTAPINGDNNANNQLATGDVFAVLTNRGNHAKVKVLSYNLDLLIRWVIYQG